MGAQTAQSQSDVSFEHQHMIREAFTTFHSEGLVCFNIKLYDRATSPSFCLTKDDRRCLFK